MSRRAILLGVAVVAIAVVGVLATVISPRACACLPPPSFGSPVDGVVTAVDAASLTDVRGFTLRTSAGSSLEFKLGALENATDFSPSHLKEHQATSERIRVWFRSENGDRVAYRLEDAPG